MTLKLRMDLEDYSRAASKGTGIIAGGPVRAVCEVLGVKDIVAKQWVLLMLIM